MPPLIKEQVHREIEQRILQNYQKNIYWWETATLNWSAVYAGNVGGALMYQFPEAFEKLIPRLVDTMQYLPGAVNVTERFVTLQKNGGLCRLCAGRRSAAGI